MPFTQTMPAANSGASRPLSAASTASLRTAERRTLIDDEPSPRASSATRHAFTVSLVKPTIPAWPNQEMNSSRAMLYNRRVIGEETLLSTRAFRRCHCAAFSTTIKLHMGPSDRLEWDSQERAQ